MKNAFLNIVFTTKSNRILSLYPQTVPCLKEITSPDGPLANTINPFTKKPLLIVTKCDMADRALAGSIALEKIMPTPPGSAIPFINTPLIDTDPIDQKMPIRITMCDKGAYPIRIAEVEF